MSGVISLDLKSIALRQSWKTAYLATVICGGVSVIVVSIAWLIAAPAPLPLFVLIGLTILQRLRHAAPADHPGELLDFRQLHHHRGAALRPRSGHRGRRD